VVAVAVFLAPAAATATPVIGYVNSFNTLNTVEGIAFDPLTGNLFYVRDSTRIYEVTTTGVPVGTITSAVGDIRGIDVLPNGNLVIAHDGSPERIVEIDRTGAIVAGGINFNVTAAAADNNGVVYN